MFPASTPSRKSASDIEQRRRASCSVTRRSSGIGMAPRLCHERANLAWGSHLKRHPRHTMRFHDHTGTRRQLGLFSSKYASETAERRIHELLEVRQANAALRPELLAFLASIPPRMRERLLEWGVVDGKNLAVATPPQQLVDEWEADLRRKVATEKYVLARSRMVRRVIHLAGWETWLEVKAADAERVLDEQTGPAPGWSQQTRNSYVGALKQFGAWLVKTGRAHESPFQFMARRVGAAEVQRRLRRPLTDDEVARLVEAARGAGRRGWMTGPERAALWAVMVGTGLRSREAGDLRVRSIRWSEPGRAGALELPAAGTKEGRLTGRDSLIPLAPDVEATLREHVGGREGRRLVFPQWKPQDGARVLRGDLKLAGIPYQDDAGRFCDVHSLRHTFGTRLMRSGAGVRDVQRLMRHGTLEHTERYLHTTEQELQARLPSLPEIGGKVATESRANAPI